MNMNVCLTAPNGLAQPTKEISYEMQNPPMKALMPSDKKTNRMKAEQNIPNIYGSKKNLQQQINPRLGTQTQSGLVVFY